MCVCGPCCRTARSTGPTHHEEDNGDGGVKQEPGDCITEPAALGRSIVVGGI